MNALVVKVLIAALGMGGIVGAYEAWSQHERSLGEALAREKYSAQVIANLTRQVADARAAAAETERRLKAQKENQDAQDKELAAARSDAARNARDADRLRQQNVTVARQWRDALGSDSATREDREAAADAIGVLTDLLGRADRRAGILAAYADAARAAGLLCERDYDALTAPKAP